MIICYSMLEDSPNQPALRLPRVDHTSCEDFDRATSILEIQRSFRISWCRGGGYGGKIMSFFLIVIRENLLVQHEPIVKKAVDDYA
jgi:hypothetical protein